METGTISTTAMGRWSGSGSGHSSDSPCASKIDAKTRRNDSNAARKRQNYLAQDTSVNVTSARGRAWLAVWLLLLLLAALGTWPCKGIGPGHLSTAVFGAPFRPNCTRLGATHRVSIESAVTEDADADTVDEHRRRL